MPKPSAADVAKVRRVAMAFPGMEEGTSYGTIAYRVAKKFLARIHDDGVSLVIKVDFGEREILMEIDPKTFYITEHYRRHPAMLVRIDRVAPSELHRLFEQLWRRHAPKRLVSAYDCDVPSSKMSGVARKSTRSTRRLAQGRL